VRQERVLAAQFLADSRAPHPAAFYSTTPTPAPAPARHAENSPGDGALGAAVPRTTPKSSLTTVKKPSAASEWHDDVRIMKNLGRFLWSESNNEYRQRLVGAMALMVTGKLLNVQVPIVFKHAIDMLTEAAPVTAAAVSAEPTTAALLATPAAIMIGYGAIRLGASACNELRNAVFSKVTQGTMRRVSMLTFDHLHKLDHTYHLNRETGSLSRILDRGSRGISFMLNAVVFNMIPTTLEISLVAGILSYRFGWEFGALTAGTLAAYTAYTIAITQWRIQIRRHMNKMDNQASGAIVDSLLNHETVKYFNNQDFERERVNSFMMQYEDAAVRTQRSLAMLNFGQSAIVSGAMALGMLSCVQAVQAGTMTVGDIVMVNGLIFQLSLPLNFLGTIYRETRQSLVDMKNLFDILDEKPRIQEAPDAVPISKPDGGISVELRDVHFGYEVDAEANADVLRGLNLSIPAGSSIALVGGSGCGKSTVLKLLARLYDPTQGQVLLQGQDLRGCTLDSVRENVGVVAQECALFNDTIRNNIAYGRKGAVAGPEEVEEAARLADVHEAILSMPQGYETRVGERGLKLSGGEKQRLTLARAFLKDPSLLLCDEATSALDSITENNILSSLNALARGRTAVFVAHRLAVASQCDQVAVMENGRVVEQGSHADLIARNGVYASLWQQQQQQQNGETPGPMWYGGGA